VKSVLVTGGAHGDLPAIRASKRLGYRVITGGNRPSDPGHRESDDYVLFDYTDSAAVAEAAAANDVIGVVPSCHDSAAVAAARAADAIGLPGHDTPDVATRIHNKHLLRTTLRNCGIPTPRSISCATPDEASEWFKALHGPAIVKPSDLAGGRGITRIDEASQIKGAYQMARDLSPSKQVVLEEFIVGRNHGVTLLLRDQRPVFAFSDNEYYGTNPFRVAGAYSPSTLADAALAHILHHASQLAEHLRLVDGLLHLQVISGTAGVNFIEACRRPPGDFYPRLVEIATGYAYSKNFVSGYVGLAIDENYASHSNLPTIRHVLNADRSGCLRGFSIAAELQPFIIEMETWANIGDVIEDPLTWSGGVLLLQPPSSAIDNALLDISSRACAIVD